jgi:hypothetical protein
MEFDEPRQESHCDAVLVGSKYLAAEHHLHPGFSGFSRVAQAVVLNQQEGERVEEDENDDKQNFSIRTVRESVRLNISGGSLNLGLELSVHRFSVSLTVERVAGAGERSQFPRGRVFGEAF